MAKEVQVRCRCGEVVGVVANVAPRKVNRVVCHCDDCQAFAHRLGRADLLDEHGGSDIIQIAPATLTLVRGQHRIAGLRLTVKGLFRWYASCCNTPMGNTLTPKIPFVGIMAQTFEGGARQADNVFGAPAGAIFGKYAIGEAPAVSTGLNLRLVLRFIGRVLGWRLRGKAWPHPFFKQGTGEPIYPFTVLSREEREALRPLCGLHAAVVSATQA